jgi:hypothetical protein
LCAIDPATYSRKGKENLKKRNQFSFENEISLLKDRHYLSIQKTPNPEELLSILPKIATTIVQLLKLREN